MNDAEEKRCTNIKGFPVIILDRTDADKILRGNDTKDTADKKDEDRPEDEEEGRERGELEGDRYRH